MLCAATNNAHKLDELRPLLGARFDLRTLTDIGCHDELPETSDTLEGNALQKARYVWQHFGVPCFADDTGLEVRALQGAPGVDSAHYAGPARDSAANVQKLLTALDGQPDRTARFRTVIALIDANGREHLFAGIVEGRITEAPRGTGGFGYDSVFQPDGFTETFAELPLEAKNRISHRARAVAGLVQWLTTSC